jgi:DNA uptake protein ComE-like DNA-binding protein
MRRLVLTLAPALVLLACADSAQDADTMAAAGMDSAAGITADTAGATQGMAMANPNTATREQLAAAGADSAAIAALMAGRPFASMVAVDQALAARMDSTQRKTLYAGVWMPIDLNTASDQEILLIPGLGRRMLREFKEYRPYTNMAQFRREIGKYVDDQEVARLEKYVMIK